MLFACGDESYSGSPTTSSFYVVAAYIGTCSQWFEFDRLWRRGMRELKIEHLGCQAADCRSGKKEWAKFSRGERGLVRRRLIEAIADSQIFGCVAVNDLDGWRARRKKFAGFLGKDNLKFNEPHIITHRQCVHLMLYKTERATTEPISFTFDQNTDTGGRAKEWFESDKKNKNLDAPNMLPGYRARLGSYREGDSKEVLGLQAADMLAYCAHHRFVSGSAIWEWEELIAPKRISVMVFGDDYWQTIEDEMAAAQARKSAGEAQHGG